MKVLLLASYAPSLVLFRGPLIAALVAAGHEVVAVAPDIDAPLLEELRRLGATPLDLPLSRTGMNPVHDLLYGWRLYRAMRRLRPDLVLSYTAKPNIWGAFAASAAGVRSAAMVTGLGFAFTDAGERNWKRALVQKVQTWLYRRATDRNAVVVFQNPDDRDDFIAAGCLADPGKVRMVNGSGVDLDHFRPAPPPDAPHFLMIARLLKSKGVREYAEAAIRLKARHPAARFSLVGYFDEGPDGVAPAAVAEWQAQGLDHLGGLGDVRPALAAASAYVLPSYREGTPRSVLEAMATGRAILTTDVPGCRETVVDGVNGFLVPARDADVLADRMGWMIENPEAVAAMGEQSLRIAREKYDVHAVNETLMTHLGLDRPGPGRPGLTRTPDAAIEAGCRS